MMSRILLASLAAAAVLGGAPASAQMSLGESPRAEVTRAQAQERAARMFARLDANRDGRIDQADRAARQQARFDRLDADGDGAISRAEFAASRKGRAHARAERGGKRQRPAMRARGGRIGQLARRADANRDGAISEAEFTAGALALFDRADADRDGTVTAAERRAAREQAREIRRNRAAQR